MGKISSSEDKRSALIDLKASEISQFIRSIAEECRSMLNNLSVARILGDIWGYQGDV